MMDIKLSIFQWSIKLLIKKLQVKQLKMKNISNKYLAEELDKPIIKEKLERKSTLTFYRQHLWR